MTLSCSVSPEDNATSIFSVFKNWVNSIVVCARPLALQARIFNVWCECVTAVFFFVDVIVLAWLRAVGYSCFASSFLASPETYLLKSSLLVNYVVVRDWLHCYPYCIQKTLFGINWCCDVSSRWLHLWQMTWCELGWIYAVLYLHILYVLYNPCSLLDNLHRIDHIVV